MEGGIYIKIKFQAFFNVLLGIGLIAGSFYMYNDFLLWEQQGGTRRMWIGFSIAYDLVGPYAGFVIMIPFSLFFFYNAYKLLTGKQSQEEIK